MLDGKGKHPRTKREPRQQKSATLKHGSTVSIVETFQGRRVAKMSESEIGEVVLAKRGVARIVCKDGTVYIIRY